MNRKRFLGLLAGSLGALAGGSTGVFAGGALVPDPLWKRLDRGEAKAHGEVMDVLATMPLPHGWRWLAWLDVDTRSRSLRTSHFRQSHAGEPDEVLVDLFYGDFETPVDFENRLRPLIGDPRLRPLIGDPGVLIRTFHA